MPVQKKPVITFAAESKDVPRKITYPFEVYEWLCPDGGFGRTGDHESAYLMEPGIVAHFRRGGSVHMHFDVNMTKSVVKP